MNEHATGGPRVASARQRGALALSADRTAVQAVSTLVRLGLAAVFLAAGALKVVDPQSSVQAVSAYALLPAGLETVVGWGLPFVEMALGLLLAAGLVTRVTALASAALLLVFLAGVASAAARGLSIDCGCFGGGGAIAPGQTRYPAEMLRDLGLLALAGWLTWRPRSLFSLDPVEVGAER